MSKLILLLMLLAILLSLGFAVFYLVHDRGTTDRAARALTWRTLLSIALFLVVLIGAAVGVIGPRQVTPPEPARESPPVGSHNGTGTQQMPG
jgi:putative copper export protein